MEISTIEKAKILIEALPYIQKYHGKTVVIKYGGSAMMSEELKSMVMSDIALLTTIGVKVVLVHGGGKDINKMLDAMNIESHFVNGLRYTSKEAMSIIEMVLSGKVNKSLVSALSCQGARAIGLSGIDGNLITARKLEEEGVDYGYVGEIVNINDSIIKDMLNNGYVPIISTIGKNEEGETFNLNADTAACEIAEKLGAENVVLLTDVKGLYKDINDPSTFMPVLYVGDVDKYIEDGIIAGGMLPKIKSIVKAINGGAKKAIILDGREPHSILIELLSDKGVGTLIKNSSYLERKKNRN